MTSSINDEEFHRQSLEGGASRSTSDNTVPTRGYMVGGASNISGERFPEEKYSVDSYSVNQVRQHARALKKHFGEMQAIHQGAWLENDNVVLDASEREDNYYRAVRKADRRGERAIYDLDKGRDVHVIPQPRKK